MPEKAGILREFYAVGGQLIMKAERKKKEKEKEKDMRDKKGRRIDIEYGTERFTYINPEYAREEKEKMEGMSLEEKIDYLFHDSALSIGLQDDDWTRIQEERMTIYRKEDSSSKYSQFFGAAVNETEICTLTIIDGKKAVYTRYVTGFFVYDDGTLAEEEPIFEVDHDDEAMNTMTGGLWRVIYGKD